MSWVSPVDASIDAPDSAGIIAELIDASHELTAALQQHQDVAVAPELREQLAGFVAALLTTNTTATAPSEDDSGDRVEFPI